MLSGTRVGVSFMISGAILIILGTLNVGGGDLIHTVATTLIVFGAVVLSVATEGQDEATD